MRFDEMTGLTLDDAELWRLALESVAFGEMPPKDAPQPTEAQRAAFVAWLGLALKSPELAADHHQALYSPAEGNRVDHTKLFDGSVKGPAWSPPRMWRRSQPQYDAMMEQLWVIPRLRQDYAPLLEDPELAGFGYARPFPQMDPEQFTNYSGGVHADESTLRALLDAGHQVALRLTAEKPKYHELHQPPIQAGLHGIRRGSPWEKYKVDPPGRAPQFEPFMVEDAAPTQAQRSAAVDRVFQLIHGRPPSEDESQRYGGLLDANIERSGAAAALRGLITAVIISPEFVFRMEVGMSEPDAHGRRMLSPRELTYAIAYALTDAGPDAALLEAAAAGRLATRADVERQVRRILEDDAIEKLPKLRFWQEFFGYTEAMDVFKEQSPHGNHRPRYLIRDADQLIEYILKEDRQVFRELLTTDRYFAGMPSVKDPQVLKAWIDYQQEAAHAGVEKSKQQGKEIKPPQPGKYSSGWSASRGYTVVPRARHNDEGGRSQQYIMIYGFDGETFDWPRDQPFKIADPRLGMLMHPAWLIAHSANLDNDIVGRGHWIRERLFAGTMPSIPIDVEAQVPEDEHKTLRQRMEVTRAEYCWKCHKRMDPLGLPFESYDHFGWYRTEEITDERRRNKVPVDASGAIAFSGEAGLDGPVSDARELVLKLGGSERVRQSIIRHAFRYWMGRNEMLSDSPTLIAADKAYVDSDGSFNELLVSLLTSDSFLYRK